MSTWITPGMGIITTIITTAPSSIPRLRAPLPVLNRPTASTASSLFPPQTPTSFWASARTWNAEQPPWTNFTICPSTPAAARPLHPVKCRAPTFPWTSTASPPLIKSHCGTSATQSPSLFTRASRRGTSSKRTSTTLWPSHHRFVFLGCCWRA